MNEKIALKQLNSMKKHGRKMRLAAESWVSPWQTLISIILSARSRDEVTIIVSKNLFNKYPNSKKLASAKTSEIEKLIRPINFYRNKTKNIINCSKELIKKYKGKIPQNIEGLIELPGVGRKTANVFLSELGKPAIGTDTHVSYISRKLGWTQNKKQEKIELDLKNLFSERHWNDVNSTLVRFGKTHTSKREKDSLLEKIRKIK